MRACNAGLPAPLRVRRFLLLDQPFEAEDVEARLYRERFRRMATERYAGLVDALFRDRRAAPKCADDDAAARPAPGMVEDVEGPVVPRLEPAHA